MPQNPARELHRIVTTVIIYNDDGQFLITKRSPDKKAYPNKWTVPGGGLTIDDYINTPKTTGDAWYYALTESMHRELKEETNVIIDKVRYLLDTTFIRPDNIPVIILSYYAHYVSGEIKLDEDSVAFAWITPEEAKHYDLIEGIAEEIEMVDKIIKGASPDSVQFVPRKK